MSLIELQGISKSYHNGQEDLTVLEDIHLSIDKGEVLIVTGESGCGKSTLLNLIGGLDFPTAGKIISCGEEVSSLSENEMTQYRNQKLGFIFQFHYLLKDFTAMENIIMPALMAGIDRKTATHRALELLEQVGLTGRTGHYPGQLSGGERQRIVMARALINDPDLILADEPTGNLDERHSLLVEDILFKLTRDMGKTLILVTHDPLMAKRGDRHAHLTLGGLNLE